MKVLMQIRRDAFTKHGGDTLQMLQYQRSLKRLGVGVDVCPGLSNEVRRYDVVHLFNLDRPLDTYAQLLSAKKAGKPVVLSSIHRPKRFVQPYELSKRQESISRWIPLEAIEIAKDFLRVTRGDAQFGAWKHEFLLGQRYEQEEILRRADIVCLLAQAEEEEITKDFGVRPVCTRVVPNGHNGDSPIEELPSETAQLLSRAKGAVIAVGRIEAQKNQVAILDALSDTGLPLFFAGSVNRWHKRYFEAFLKKVDAMPNAAYIGSFRPAQMNALYRAGRVHVLASWFECAPLVDLEAAYGGCQIVTTACSYAPEYAASWARFIQPGSLSSIRKAVLSAYNERGEPRGRDVVREKFTWDRAARILNEIYTEVIDKVSLP